MFDAIPVDLNGTAPGGEIRINPAIVLGAVLILAILIASFRKKPVADTAAQEEANAYSRFLVSRGNPVAQDSVTNETLKSLFTDQNNRIGKALVALSEGFPLLSDQIKKSGEGLTTLSTDLRKSIADSGELTRKALTDNNSQIGKSLSDLSDSWTKSSLALADNLSKLFQGFKTDITAQNTTIANLSYLALGASSAASCITASGGNVGGSLECYRVKAGVDNLSWLPNNDNGAVYKAVLSKYASYRKSDGTFDLVAVGKAIAEERGKGDK